MNDILIRVAREDDLPPLINLWTEFMRFHADLDPAYALSAEAAGLAAAHLSERIRSEQSVVYAATRGQELIGYCVACLRDRPPVFLNRAYGHITDLGVSPASRGQKVGEKLFLAAKQWFMAHGISRIEVRTLTSNPLSNAFWNKQGFRNFAEEKFLVLEAPATDLTPASDETAHLVSTPANAARLLESMRELGPQETQ